MGEEAIGLIHEENKIFIDKTQKSSSLQKNENASIETYQRLLNLIQITEEITTTLSYKKSSEETMQQIINAFSEKSTFSLTILLKSEENENLRLFGTTKQTHKAQKTEELSDLNLIDYEIPIQKSNTFQKVISEKKTIITPIKTITKELLPRPIPSEYNKTLDYDKNTQQCIITPLKKFDDAIGAIMIKSHELNHHFISTIKHFSQHITHTLEHAEEYQKKKKQQKMLMIYKLAVEHAHDLIIAVDKNYKVTLANKSFLLTHQMKNDRILGKHIEKIIGTDSFHEIKEYLSTCLTGKKIQYHLEKTVPNFGRRHYNVFFYPLKEKSNEIIGAAMILYDITNREQTEEKLKRTHQELKESIQERDLLLEEIHHRVKNNLQLIISLIDIQLENQQPQQHHNFADEIKNRIHLMALLHQQLYQSPDLKHVVLGEYIQNITEKIDYTYHNDLKDISITTEHHHELINFKQATSCGLIVNELVLNSLKHAFIDRKHGQIQIKIASTERKHIICVKDNGKGFPETIDFQHPCSLGLQLVHMLVKQLKGRITLHQQQGTIITIRFPKKTLEEKRDE